MALGNPVPSDYSALFRNYLKRATRSALQPPTPQDTFPQTGGYERTSQLIHTLTYALKSPDMWDEAKELLFSLSETLERTARHADLIALLEAGLNQSSNVEDSYTGALLQIRLAPLILTQDGSDRARQLLIAAKDYFESNAHSLHLGQALNGLGRWAIQRGNFGEATGFAESALKILPTNAYNELGTAYRLLGAIAMDRQDWEASYKAHSESLRLWKLGNNTRLVGSGWVNVGSTLRGLGQFEEAISAFRQGIERFEAAEDLVNRAIAQMNLGNLYLHRLLYHEAIEYYHAAETVFRQLNRISDLARLYNNWGMAYARLEWWEQAIRTYQQSIEYWESLQNRHLTANSLDNLGLAFFGAERYEESADAYRRGLAELEQAQGSNDPILLAELHQHLAEVEQRLSGV